MIQTINREELKPFLMDPKAVGLLKEPYFIIKADTAYEVGQEVVVITPGKNGMEFNKTIGTFHRFVEVQTYHVAYGQGMLLVQRNDLEGEAKEFRVISLRAGLNVEVPAGYGHCLVNIGKTYLVVVADVNPLRSGETRHYLQKKRGFVYYLVDKKGDIGFEPNPNYHLHPQITMG